MVGTYRVGVVSGLAGAIVQYILTFVIVYVMALIMRMSRALLKFEERALLFKSYAASAI
jgi:hypothetical protein